MSKHHDNSLIPTHLLLFLSNAKASFYEKEAIIKTLNEILKALKLLA